MLLNNFLKGDKKMNKFKKFKIVWWNPDEPIEMKKTTIVSSSAERHAIKRFSQDRRLEGVKYMIWSAQEI
jgi:hypothetical protein